MVGLLATVQENGAAGKSRIEVGRREIMIEEFSIETVEVGGFPIPTFKHRFKSIWEMFCQSVSD